MRRLFVFFLLLIFSLTLPAAVLAAGNSDLQEGMNLYYKKEWEGAKLSFEKALSSEPTDSLTLSYYFSCFLWTDTMPLAVKKAEEEYVKNPNDINALIKLAFAYYGMGQMDLSMQDEAKNEFREILTLNPDISVAHTGIGMLYNDKRMTPRAKAEFSKALSLNSKDVIALELMGVIVMIDDVNPQGSLDYFRKILDVVPNYPDANFYMGSAYYKLGKYDEALPYLLKASELDPLAVGKGYFSLVLSGDIYMKLKKYPDAVSSYEKALTLEPNNIAAQAKLEKAKAAQKENE